MLESVDSLATRTCCFTHFIGHMLALWNSLIRTWPAGVLALRDSDLFAPLVLPGARLSAAVLRIYASFAAGGLRADALKLQPLRKWFWSQHSRGGGPACASELDSTSSVCSACVKHAGHSHRRHNSGTGHQVITRC